MEMPDTLRSITDFADEVVRLRQALQDGRCLTRDEVALIKNTLTIILRDLECNQKRRVPISH